jgi:glycosyltransferase involved in cell wall biosynthesis
MNILLVANGYPPSAYGGVEVYVYQLASHLVNLNHQVTVFCRESAENKPDYERIGDNLNGVKVIRVVNDFKNTTSFKDTFDDERIEQYFADTLREISPDIVHINHLIALSYKLPQIVKEIGLPTVISLHDYWPFCFRVRLVDWQDNHCPGQLNGGDCYQCIQGGDGGLKTRVLSIVKGVTPYSWRQGIRRRIFRRSSPSILGDLSQELLIRRYQDYKDAILSANRIFVPSKYIRTQYYLNGYPKDRIEVVRLGIDVPGESLGSPTRQVEKKQRDEIRFIFVGMMIPNKGLDILIKAFKKLDNEKIRLYVYGRDDIVPAYYRNLLRDLSNGDERIVFRGPFGQDERRKVYEDCDIVVIPSRFPETFSLVAHEAFAFGKPVIASDIGALPEVVIDGQNGFLVPPGNVLSLTKLMDRVVREPESLSDLNIPGPVKVYSIADHVDYLTSIYLKEINA